MLANEEILPKKYKDHFLQGNWQGYRECHVKPDLLLIYKLENDKLTLTLVRTGSHSDLF
jgi:mRNA interferase YafQ